MFYIFLIAIAITCIADCLTDSHFDPERKTRWRLQTILGMDLWHVVKLFRFYPMILLAGYLAIGLDPLKWALAIPIGLVSWKLFSPWPSRWMFWR